MYFDSLNFYNSGRFSESIVLANILLEVFFNTYLTEKLNYEGKTKEEAKDFVERIFNNGVQGGLGKVFFGNIKHEKLGHPIYRIFVNIRG